MKTKIISVIAALMTVVVLFTSCATDSTQTSSDNSEIVSSTTESKKECEYFLNEVPLDEYCVVYAEDEYGYSRDVARQFRRDLQQITGATLKISEDTKGEYEYEIVVGTTSREVNFTEDTLQTLEYGYVTEGNKVIINAGAPYMLELATDKLISLFSMEKNMVISHEPRKFLFEFTPPKSVILLIGDGMGENHIRYTVENGLDTWIGDIMPSKGDCTTASVYATTDSAAAATALSTGYKTKNGMIGKDKNGDNLKIMGELVLEKGKQLMVMSNYSIYDATPAAFTAHATDRELSTTIQEQQAALGALVLESYDTNIHKGFVEALAKYDTLEEKNGFFLMGEEGYCDSAGHNNVFGHSVNAVTRMDELIRYAISYLLHHPDTVLIVTADHETGGITKNESTGEWEFTTTTHTGVNVPVYAMGYGTETFNGKTVDNTDISKFIAHIMGDSEWGDQNIPTKVDFPELN